MSPQLTFTKELEPYLDLPSPSRLPGWGSHYTNPFGAIARPGINSTSEPLDSSKSNPSLIITHAEVDDPVFAPDTCGLQPEPIDASRLDLAKGAGDRDYYNSTPHYISSIWHYLTPDDDLEADKGRTDHSIPEPENSTQFEPMNPGSLAIYIAFPWNTTTPSLVSFDSPRASGVIPRTQIPSQTIDIDMYSRLPSYASEIFSSEPTERQTACNCVQCNPPRDRRGFDLRMDASDSSLSLSPPETPLLTPYSEYDETFYPSLSQIEY
ncbi:hypothetical protein F5050DRAFT_1803900 [Lentinula boryana]|uniref:Uncharacterized protein n=1 Tax=Lentinula boryana TaxID=40481 RepID=A0ABQ8QQP8_9AGAR|nr:hypothetical protein F5050DRAFT_1803900 [Lentinula boryana]